MRRSTESWAAGNGLAVSVHHGAAAVAEHADLLDALTAVARRPTPFSRALFLESVIAHAEVGGAADVRLYVVSDGDRPIAALAFRVASEPFGRRRWFPGIPATTLVPLADHDAEQVGLVCRPDDEERAATALVEALTEAPFGYALVELLGQHPGSPLHRAAHAAGRRWYRVRDVAVGPVTEVVMRWPDLANYYQALSKRMRSNVGRQARRLFAAGDVELVFADGQAAADWFAAYLDLEARSWKGGTSSAVGRNPKRRAFYAEIANGGAGFAPSFVGVVLDGVLIAGLIVAADAAPWAHADGAWCMEMAFDEAHAELGPGNLLLLLAVGEALADGDRYLNFLQNFAYFKHRWLADSIEMVNVELCRRLGPYYVKGRLGDVRRWFLTRRGRTEEIYGASKGHPDRIAPAVTDAEQSRALVAAARRSGSPGLRILDRCGAEDYLPFSVQ